MGDGEWEGERAWGRGCSARFSFHNLFPVYAFNALESKPYLFFPECNAMTCSDNIQSISCHKKNITTLWRLKEIAFGRYMFF